MIIKYSSRTCLIFILLLSNYKFITLFTSIHLNHLKYSHVSNIQDQMY